MKKLFIHSWLIVCLFLILPLIGCEFWVKQHLFDYVSYTNSQNMDPQIKYFEDRNDWQFIALGSSEVKWGIDPSQIEQALTAKGVKASGFNLGFDGFNETFYLSILPFLSLPKRLPQLHVALIGVNLFEEKQILPSSFNDGFPCDGILQRAVLKSAFAKDYNLDGFCNSQDWKQSLVKPLERVSPIFRYRQAVRTLLLGYDRPTDLIGVISNNVKQYPNGFHAHKPARDNQDDVQVDYQHFLADKKTQPQLFQPMPDQAWSNLLKPDGFFDRWANYFLDQKILPVFFALPTNPLMIDAKNRREDYQSNSQLMSDWAKQRNIVFIDLGIMDRYDQLIDYSDHRHLSVNGAITYSRELGNTLAANPKVLAAFSH
ncbi:MAG: hypothetical protein KME21_07180 [Desmonostoc vinosum HA7617-LM4]|jgi:hypothetical protein|nr:hypothetical protein [Desmonostoc vinosum HA7617-LM4]